MRKKTDFCTQCRKETEYTLRKIPYDKTIRGKQYQFCITAAICNECGCEMDIPGIIDKNIREIDEQYRAAENIISVDDIKKLMKIYNIGKTPLSLVLGFGEVTVSRYLAGQVPSKEYSGIMKKALTSPAYMKQLLNKNRDKISGTTYGKSMKAASDLEDLFTISDKMRMVIASVFKQLEEVTPLTLQKILYFIQGLSLALYDRPMFPEDCEAWVHGPVYHEVYSLFRSFKYNPIDDDRFAVIEGAEHELSREEQRIIDLVVNTFGMYSGKTLERITHKEAPWITARRGYEDTAPSSEVLTKDSIKSYFKNVNKKFPLDSEYGINEYINAMLSA